MPDDIGNSDRRRANATPKIVAGCVLAAWIAGMGIGLRLFWFGSPPARNPISTAVAKPVPLSNPQTAADFYHNARVHSRNGDRAAAEEAYWEYFARTKDEHYDVFMRFGNLLRAEYNYRGLNAKVDRLLKTRPSSPSARFLELQFCADDGSRELHMRFVADFPDYLPELVSRDEFLQHGQLISDLQAAKSQAEFKRYGGVDAFRSFLFNETEEPGKSLLETARRIERRPPLDPMQRLTLEVRREGETSFLWARVKDSRPWRSLTLHFPHVVEATLFVNSWDIPAVATPLESIAVEIDAAEEARKDGVRFVPRTAAKAQNAGYLRGVEIGKPIKVGVSYVDADGRSYHFPDPVTLFKGESR